MTEEGRRVRSRGPFILLGVAGLGAAAALVALPVVPSFRHEVGPIELSTRAQVGVGRTILRLPPLGTISADTHLAPITLEHSLADLDIVELADRFSNGRPVGDLESQLEDGLRGMALVLVWQFTLAGFVVGGIGAALLPKRRFTTVAAGAVGGALAIVATVVVTGVTFDVDAFEQPRFTGALTRAPVVLEAISRGEVTLEQVRSRYETAAGRLSDLLALVAEPHQDPRTDTTAILHVSDIHSNPLGVEIAGELAERFEVDAVIDTGDITNFGVQLESNIGSLLEDVGAPYFIVPGNHDSAANERALAAVDNVTVVHGEAVDISGISVLGWRDPTYTNWNRIPPEEASEIRSQEADAVAAAVIEQQPDVLAVHDKLLAGRSFGEVDLVLAGHDHEEGLERIEGTYLLRVGSTGATGFKFFVESDRPYEAEVVYFRSDLPVAVDYIRFRALGDEFEIERSVLRR